MTDIFVFGSNLAGHHGRGAAAYALKYRGAIFGQGEGRQGQSYAIPTKDAHLSPLREPIIAEHVAKFLYYAELHPELRFKVSAVGTGLRAISHRRMAIMFALAPRNCSFDERWRPFLPVGTECWGTHDDD